MSRSLDVVQTPIAIGALEHQSAGKPQPRITGTPFAGTPFAGTPFAGTPFAGTPFAGTPVAGTPFAGTPFAIEGAEIGCPPVRKIKRLCSGGVCYGRQIHEQSRKNSTRCDAYSLGRSGPRRGKRRLSAPSPQ